METMLNNKVWLTTFIGLILIATAVGVLGLQADSMWHDEQLSLLYAGALSDEPINPLNTVTRIIERESGQAPFYYMLLTAWGSLVGWSVFAARAFSLLVGVLAIAWTYRLGRDMHSPFAGLCAAIVLGTSAFFSAYLHEIRTYSLLVLEILMILTLYWRMLKSPRSVWMSVIFLIVTHCDFILSSLCHRCGRCAGIVSSAAGSTSRHMVAAVHPDDPVRHFVFALGAITLGVIANRVENNTRTLTIRSNAEVIRDMLHAFSNGFWVFLLLLIPSLPLLRKDHAVRLLWFVTVVFAGVMLAANQLSDMINHIRYMMPLLPLLVLLMGIGLASLITYRRMVTAGVGSMGDCGGGICADFWQLVLHL